MRMTLLPWVLGTPNDPGYRAEQAVCQIWTSKGPGYGLVATTNPYSGAHATEEAAGNAEYIHRAAHAMPVLQRAVTDLMTLAMEIHGITPEQATLVCTIGATALESVKPRPVEKPRWLPFKAFKTTSEADAAGYRQPGTIGRGGWECFR